MAISLIAVGGWATGTTSLSVAYPAGIQAGDLLVLAIANKYPTNSPSVPTDWAIPTNGQQSGGSGSNGNDTGSVYATIMVKIATGSETGNLSISITSGNSAVAEMALYRKAADKNWEYVCTNGSDNSAGTDWSVTGAANPGITAGDRMFTCSGINADSFTFSSHAMSATGVTFGAVQADGSGTSLGQDCDCVLTDHAVSSGTASAAPVFTMSSSGSATNSPAGATVIMRMREVNAGVTLTAEAGSFSLSGNTAGLLSARKVAADQGTYSFTGNAAGLNKGYKVAAATGSYSFTGNDVNFPRTYKLSANTGGYALTGTDAAVETDRKMPADTAVYSYSSIPANLYYGRNVIAEVGTYVFSGVNAGLLVARKLSADTVGYTTTGIDTVLITARELTGDQGLYVYTGNDANLIYSPTGNFTLVANTGSFIVTGQAASLKANRVISAAAELFNITGNGTGLLTGRKVIANTGVYSFTGSAGLLLAHRILQASPGSYFITGIDLRLLKGHKISAEQGQLLLNGQTINLIVGRILITTHGIYIITGNTANLIAEGLELTAEPGQYVFTGNPATLLMETMADKIVRLTNSHVHENHFH